MTSNSQPPDLPPAKVPYDASARRRESLDLPVPDLGPPPIKCQACNRMLPAGQFSSLPDEERCDWCVSEANAKAAEREHREAMDLMGELLVQGEVTAPKLPLLEDICARAVDRFGGVDGFIQKWFDHFEKVMELRPTSIGVLNHFSGLFKLIAEANKHKHVKEVDQMTAEEIRREQQLMLLQMFTEAAADESRREFLTKLLQSQGIVLELTNGE